MYRHLLFFVLTTVATQLCHADTQWQDVKWRVARSSFGVMYFHAPQQNIGDGLFRVYVLQNLPESEIIGAPESQVTEIEGSCPRKIFHIMGHALFAQKKANGGIVDVDNGDQYTRRITAQSEFYPVFKEMCKTK